MIDPVIFSFKLFGLTLTITWYGVIVMTGVLIGAWIAEREVRRRGENSEVLIDAMIWAVIIGILGARLWFVVNSTLGGNQTYIQDPLEIIRPPIQGLHFFGGLLFGGITLAIFLKRNGYDTWLFLDAIAPAALLGQAFGRLANFINQELYGPPTTLPWGIPIEAGHRIAQFPIRDYPYETTRFHPTFAYEIILNVLVVLFLIWLSRRHADKMKPGTIFSAWLLLAGLSRTFIEFFRPDQARIGETFISYTMAVSFLMAIVGLVMLLIRHGKLQFAFAEGWADEYQVKKVGKKPRVPSRAKKVAEPVVEAAEETAAPKPARRKVTKGKQAEKKTPAKKTLSKTGTTRKAPVKKTPAKRKTEK
jgi:phosphatidylglycerol---prolipoprotein diacylglyceryl transferase